MLAAPVALPAGRYDGPRPINLPKDSKSVLRLLDQTFGPLKDVNGQRQIGDRVSLNLDPPLLYRLNIFSSGFRPGFVWEEDGQIIANVSIVQSQLLGRYLIANVAVHPDFRGMGYGRGLMEESIRYISNFNGREILLQVRSENSPAVHLYKSMGFTPIGTMKYWGVSTSRLRLPSPAKDKSPAIRRLQRNEWSQAFELDRSSVSPNLNWPLPPYPEKYHRGLISRLDGFINGINIETWVSVDEGEQDRKARLSGLVHLKSEWRRSMRLELRVLPETKEKLAPSLLNKGLARLKSWRSGVVIVGHPAEDEFVSNLLDNSNFKERETLLVMRLVLE